MRRRYSLVTGLVLIAAMLAGQASVSVLAQSTPVAGIKQATGVYADVYAFSLEAAQGLKGTPHENDLLDLLLFNISFEPKSAFDIPNEETVPSAVFQVTAGQLEVDVTTGKDMRVNVGTGPVIRNVDDQVVCEKGPKEGCKLKPGDKVILGKGNFISLTESRFIVKWYNGELASSAKAFQGGGNANARGSVLQPASPCYICPRPY